MDVQKELSELLDTLKERLGSPFFSRFLITWNFYNWKILYVSIFFGEKYGNIDKLKYLEQYFAKDKYYCYLWIPFLISIVILALDELPKYFKEYMSIQWKSFSHNFIQKALENYAKKLDLSNPNLLAISKTLTKSANNIKEVQSSLIPLSNSINNNKIVLNSSIYRGPQNSDIHLIKYNELLKSLSFKFTLNKDYLRIGLKLGLKQLLLFDKNNIITNNTYLVHLAFNNSTDLYLVGYDHSKTQIINKPIKNFKYTVPSEIKVEFIFELDKLIIKLNDLEIYNTATDNNKYSINYNYLVECYLMAWGDNREIVTEISELEFTTR